MSMYTVALAALNAYTTGSLPDGTTMESPKQPGGITYYNIPSQESTVPPWDSNGGSGNGGSGGSGGDETDLGGGPNTLGGSIPGVDEGFLDILNKAIAVVKPIATNVLKVGLPIALGPVLGGPVAALAGVALNVAGKIAASSTGTEADIGKSYTFEGVAERAILGEAAIACLKKMGNDKCKETGIFDSMAQDVKTLAPTVQRVAPKVVPFVAEPALRMSLNSISKIQAGTEDTFASDPVRGLKQSETNTTGFGSRLPPNQQWFVNGLGEALQKEDGESFLSVLSTIGDVVSKGLRVAGPILGTVAKTGLSLLLPGTESELGPPGSFSFEGLAERSLVGEAALRAVMNLPPATVEEEGLFDIFKQVVKTIGPGVIKTAPSVISAVTSVAHTLMQQPSSGGEIGGGSGGASGGQGGQEGQGEVIVSPDGDVKIDAADAASWSAEHPTFSQDMHMLEPAGSADIEALVASIEKGTTDPQQFGADSILFAIAKYVDLVHHSLDKSGPLKSYLKVFGTFNGSGSLTTVAATSLAAQYPSLASASAQAELRTIQSTVMSLEGAELPLYGKAIWFWYFVLSAIEKPGAVFAVGSNVVLVPHVPVGELSTNFGFSPAAPHDLTMSSADYVALIRNMMVAFTTNVYPPHKDLSVW